MPHVCPTNSPTDESSNAHRPSQVELDLDAVRRVADGLDVDNRGPPESEVLLWHICSAKSRYHHPSSDFRRVGGWLIGPGDKDKNRA
jgi:hypothetical protein